jgi:hypothetical protein
VRFGWERARDSEPPSRAPRHEDVFEREAAGAPLFANYKATDPAGGTELGLEAEDSAESIDASLARRCEEERRIGAEDLATASEKGLADTVAEQAVAADTDEASGQDVL